MSLPKPRILMTALKGYSDKRNEIGHSMEDIAEFARKMVVETESNPPPCNGPPLDLGFFASFWLYPKADALS
jgi:hypothetical protein